MTEQLEDLADLGGNLVDTADTHDKGQLGLPGDVEVTLLLGFPLQPKLIQLLLAVLLGVLLSPLEGLDLLGLLVGLDLQGLFGAQSSGLRCALPLLEKGLRNCRQFVIRHFYCSCRSESSNISL